MRLKIIGIQYEGDKHGKKLCVPPKKTKKLEDIVKTNTRYTATLVMVHPCNFCDKKEDNITSIWNHCRDVIKETNLKVMFVKWGIRFIVSSRSPYMKGGYCKENFTNLNLHQFGPTWNDHIFFQSIKSNFYMDMNSTSDQIKYLYKKIEEEKEKRANKLYHWFAAIGDKETEICQHSFIRSNVDLSMTTALKCTLLLPYIIGICKKSSRNKLIETLSIYSYNNQRYKDSLVEEHINIILEDKLYKGKIVDDEQVNKVGEVLDSYLSSKIQGYNGSMLQHACNYLKNYCYSYD